MSQKNIRRIIKEIKQKLKEKQQRQQAGPTKQLSIKEALQKKILQ